MATKNSILSKRVFVVFINSLIFNLFFNSPIIFLRYMDYRIAGKNAFFAAILEFIAGIFFVFPIIYVAAKSRLALVFIYLVSAIISYFAYSYNLIINYEIVASVFEASKQEIVNFINFDLVSDIFISVCFATIAYYSVKFSYAEKTSDNRLKFMMIVFTISALVGDADWIINFQPYNWLKYSGQYILEKNSLINKQSNIATKFSYDIDQSEAEDLNIVLIIGESARSDHFGLSGYKRNTTPFLSKEQNLIYYKHITACFPLTRVAVPCMLTRMTREDRISHKNESSFIGVFKKLGFYTTWLGMQGTYNAIDSPYYELASEANKVLLLGTDVNIFSSNDLSLIPFVKDFFIKHKAGKNLLILHTYGSHFPYEERYPDEFRKFKPICKKQSFLTTMSHCTQEEITNSYDNSILFTDYFIKQVIDQIRDKKALVIYTSDHGESLGEEGRTLHGTHNKDEQIAVNMVIWSSDKYNNSFPKFTDALKSHQNEASSHDYLFHSILGCSGIKSDVINQQLDLCSNNAK